jgi:hypothetical protein
MIVSTTAQHNRVPPHPSLLHLPRLAANLRPLTPSRLRYRYPHCLTHPLHYIHNLLLVSNI